METNTHTHIHTHRVILKAAVLYEWQCLTTWWDLYQLIESCDDNRVQCIQMPDSLLWHSHWCWHICFVWLITLWGTVAEPEHQGSRWKGDSETQHDHFLSALPKQTTVPLNRPSNLSRLNYISLSGVPCLIQTTRIWQYQLITQSILSTVLTISQSKRKQQLTQWFN